MSKHRHLDENDTLKAQIGVSISLSRSIPASWLPPQTEAERQADSQKNASKSTAVLHDRRLPNAGLGSTGEKVETADLSIEQLKLKRKLLHKRRKLEEAKISLEAVAPGKKIHGGQNVVGHSSGEEEEKMQKGEKRRKILLTPRSKSYAAYLQSSNGVTSKKQGFGRQRSH